MAYPQLGHISSKAFCWFTGITTQETIPGRHTGAPQPVSASCWSKNSKGFPLKEESYCWTPGFLPGRPILNQSGWKKQSVVATLAQHLAEKIPTDLCRLFSRTTMGSRPRSELTPHISGLDPLPANKKSLRNCDKKYLPNFHQTLLFFLFGTWRDGGKSEPERKLRRKADYRCQPTQLQHPFRWKLINEFPDSFQDKFTLLILVETLSLILTDSNLPFVLLASLAVTLGWATESGKSYLLKPLGIILSLAFSFAYFIMNSIWLADSIVSDLVNFLILIQIIKLLYEKSAREYCNQLH